MQSQSFSRNQLAQYDLRIRPDYLLGGQIVEVDSSGIIRGQVFQSGEQVCGRTDYIVIRTGRSNWFRDRAHIIHPLD